MPDDSNLLFQNLLEKTAFDALYQQLAVYIEDHPNWLDLDEKSSRVEEIEAATLEDVEIIRLDKIQTHDGTLHFDVITCCEVQIEETVRLDRQVDDVRQWLRLSCSGTLHNLSDSLSLHSVDVYQP